MINVTVVQRNGQAKVVEWLDGDGKVSRGRIPADKEVDGQVDEAVLDRAMAYGLPFARFITLQATPEAVEERLHQVGIWTAEDLEKKHAAAAGALMAVYGVDLAALKAAVRVYLKER